MRSADSYDVVVLGVDSPHEYWRETLRPFCNLVFLLPFLMVYEFGILCFSDVRGQAIRNGADAWLRLWLGHACSEIIWLPPILLMGTLLTWHMLIRQPWKMAWDTLGGMAAESLLYAFVLIMLGQITDFSFRHSGWVKLQAADSAIHSGMLLRLVTFMGAGIYEEFLFRLCLLPATYLTLRALMVPKNLAITGTIITTSLIFSLAHYLSPRDEGHVLAIMTEAMSRVASTRELWFGFVFRMLAGIFFSGLCVLRGFGITVGAHAIYDIFVGVVLISEV